MHVTNEIRVSEGWKSCRKRDTHTYIQQKMYDANILLAILMHLPHTTHTNGVNIN